MPAISPCQKVQNQAYKIVLFQFLGIILLAFFTTLIGGKTSGFSVFLGGMVYGLPNLFFVWRVFRFAIPSQATKFLTAFLIGEVSKLILCGILFLLIVKYLPVSLLSVVGGLAGAMVLFWIVCLCLFS